MNKHQKETLFVMDSKRPLNQFLDNNCEMYCFAEKKRMWAKPLMPILNMK